MTENRRARRFKEDKEAAELEELRQSHRKLQALIALMPVESRAEFVELLNGLVKDEESSEPSQASASFDHQILQIVSGAHRRSVLDGQAIPYDPERRMGERRKGDRRQPVNNNGKPWTSEQLETLRALVAQNTPIRRIALKLGRTSTAIQLKAKEIDVPLSLIV